MRKCFLLMGFICFYFYTNANNILVKNIASFNEANKNAKPGDVIILQNGEWHDVVLSATCNGSIKNPIIIKAATPGKVFITGHSTLNIGGNFIQIEGLYFTNGFAGTDAVITFRTSKNEIANNCRVTNTVINDYNNPKRLDENYWVSFYGKNNRLDHCSFLNKKNIGVLLAVILDDERNRENFHLIDHNYFGARIPLASNGGEVIRVGVSEQCQYKSNTQIEDNLFEHCDGETEIISIKSCNNNIRRNIFKECQGSVVLRHGNFNTVENNFFWGNDKIGTGGVRIINKGQWVINNLFYRCRGVGFRSPIAIMNGIPNSPANRYLEVTDALICNNSFYECSPMSFGIGSDMERTVTPKNVMLFNNLFYNTKDSLLYNVFDSINGIKFAGNVVSKTVKQQMVNGFAKTVITVQKIADLPVPASNNSGITITDSLQKIGKERLQNALSGNSGLSNASQLNTLRGNKTGANWFNVNKIKISKKPTIINCNSSLEFMQIISKHYKEELIINLTGNAYHLYAPININEDVTITSDNKQIISFSNDNNTDYSIKINAGNSLSFLNVQLNLSEIESNTFITTDTSGNANHSNFYMLNCQITNGNRTFFSAAKSSLCDSIVITNCSFSDNKEAIFKLTAEIDKKGYYNVEKLKINTSRFNNNTGRLLALVRSGTDESTMGPLFIFSNNSMKNCSTDNNDPIIHLFGVQQSSIENNNFSNCNTGSVLIKYEDNVSAKHVFRKNVVDNSGVVVRNKWVDQE